MIIQRLNGQVIDIKDYSLRFLNYHVPSPTIVHLTESIEGMDGDIFVESTYKERPMTVELMYNSKDIHDFYLLRSDFNRLFALKEAFYVIFNREKGKRWKIRLASSFMVEKLSIHAGTLNLDFIVEGVFAESVGTTLDDLTFDTEKWQTGQGLITEEPKYVHQSTNFQIFNAGDVSVDPRQRGLKITFKGASTNLKITNNTTGDVWQYNGSSTMNDTVTLDGVRSLKSGASIFGQTNKKLISLMQGWNDFTITGASGSFLITFDFRFYYL